MKFRIALALPLGSITAQSQPRQIDASNWGSITAPVYGMTERGVYRSAELFAGPNKFGSYFSGVLPSGKIVRAAGAGRLFPIRGCGEPARRKNRGFELGHHRVQIHKPRVRCHDGKTQGDRNPGRKSAYRVLFSDYKRDGRKPQEPTYNGIGSSDVPVRRTDYKASPESRRIWELVKKPDTSGPDKDSRRLGALGRLSVRTDELRAEALAIANSPKDDDWRPVVISY